MYFKPVYLSVNINFSFWTRFITTEDLNGSCSYEHVETVAWEIAGGREKWIGARHPGLSGTGH